MILLRAIESKSNGKMGSGFRRNDGEKGTGAETSAPRAATNSTYTRVPLQAPAATQGTRA
ncbi:hypothetical protein RDV84_15175 [Lysobacter yananisis]|uniref:Uncharacterized protein n=1 Tax=Lysobacter yananisis TaxID=1003114 RepID=A0ABY9P4S2_9GAMM|nr:hypothetical protein [Lysobacter yananisis]WMT01333.1 hypothetical protein RDV84_15175 [Lysobacter yananisis]